MSNKKFIMLAFLTILVFIPLIAIDWVTIIHLISHVIQLGGIELYAVSGVFIFAITILPVVGISPALTERINNNRYCRWTDRKPEKEGNAFIGFAILIFFVFTATFLTMSVTNPDRFISGQSNPVIEMFPTAVTDLIANITKRGSENAVLASWITGLLPCFTSLISFVVYLLLCMDKKEERIEKEIHACDKKIEQLNKEIDVINKDIENDDSGKVLLDNLSSYINEIQHNINEFVGEKDDYLHQIKDEQRQKFDAAQKAVEKQCWTDFNEFYERGKRRFEQIRKGNPEVWKRLLQNWKDFCQEVRNKIAIEMSSTWGSEISYAAMVIEPMQQKIKRGA